jgi:N-acetylglucosamine-6-sulfatase
MRPRGLAGAALAVVTVAAALAVATSGTSPAARAQGAAAGPPNVVLLMTDDQTLRDMEVLTRTRALIGGQGVTFTDYRSSYPLCCPARATMLTGQYSHNHKVLGNVPPNGGYALLDKQHTLPVALANRPRRGYVTTHIGKYLNGYGKKPFRGKPPGWTNWHGALRAYQMYGYVLNNNGTVRTYGDVHQEDKALYQTNVYRDLATNFVRRRATATDGRPFYLSVAFLAPHAEIYDRAGNPAPSVRPDPDDAGTFATKPLPRGGAFDEADMSDKPGWLRRQIGGPEQRLTAADVRAITRRYRARQESLLAVDRAVAAVVDTLRATGQLANTYVIFTSDNGFMEGQHRVKNGKLLAYEPAAALPLLMRGPGIPAGRVSAEPTIDVDLAPTIMDMAGASPTGWTVDGRSMLPFAEHPARPRTTRPRLQQIGPQDSAQGDLDQDGARVPAGEGLKVPRYKGVTTARYRYVRYANGQEELYDTARDPGQLDNRVDAPRYRAVRRVLRDQLERLQGCAGDSCRAERPPPPPPR